MATMVALTVELMDDRDFHVITGMIVWRG